MEAVELEFPHDPLDAGMTGRFCLTAFLFEDVPINRYDVLSICCRDFPEDCRATRRQERRPHPLLHRLTAHLHLGTARWTPSVADADTLWVSMTTMARSGGIISHKWSTA